MKGRFFTADPIGEMRRRNDLAESHMMQHVSAILGRHSRQRESVIDRLKTSDASDSNDFRAELLSPDRVFHLTEIKQMCVRHRLRFLDSSLFQDGLPSEAINAIQQLERLHEIELKGFRIAAPASAFALKNVNDPMLFVPIGDQYYYLVHQWGKDLSVWRQLIFWPVRNFGNFLLSCLFISLIFTWIIPSGALDRRVPMAKVIVFLFAFKSFFAVFFYSFYILGRRFSTAVWDSPYFND